MVAIFTIIIIVVVVAIAIVITIVGNRLNVIDFGLSTGLTRATLKLL